MIIMDLNEKIRNYRLGSDSKVRVKPHKKYEFYFNLIPEDKETLNKMLEEFDVSVYNRKTYGETEEFLFGFNQFWNEFYVLEKSVAEEYLDSIYCENYRKNDAIYGLYLNEDGYHKYLPVPFPMYVAGKIGKYSFNFIAYNPGCLISRKEVKE